jgi:hypothetical protein
MRHAVCLWLGSECMTCGCCLCTEVGRMIDATSYYELEAEEYKRKGVMLTPDLWLVKLMVGAVDQSFDEQD